ncbi:MAG: EAL domain-containing protein [Legionella sp.]|nr:EAL domain-containing protein [Legionella sp.]
MDEISAQLVRCTEPSISVTPLNLKGAIALPIIYHNEFLGVLEFYSEKELDFSSTEIESFEIIAESINGLYGFYQEKRMLNLILNSCGEGITTFVNPRACKILGYTEKELIGHSMHEKIHHSFANGKPYPRDTCAIYGCIQANKPSYIEDEVFWNKKNQPVPIEYTVTPIIENGNILGGVVTFIDVSEKRRIKRHLEIISKLQSRYITGEEKNSLFDAVLSYLIEATDSEYGFIGAVLNDKKGDPYLKTYSITNIAWNKEMRKLYAKQVLEKGGMEFRKLDSLFGYTLKTGKVVISNDPKNDERAGGLPKGHPNLNCYLGVPIFSSDNKLLAMYGIANRKGGYSETTVEDLKSLTHTISNVIESSHHYKTIQTLSRLDSLTKVYNRQYFDLKFNQIIEAHREKKQSFSILMLDLNKFKLINDTYGHQAGDDILVLFIKRMRSLLDSEHLIARLGGDEFVIIVTNVKSNQTAINLASLIAEAGKLVYQVQENKIYCEITIGIANYPGAGKTAQTLLKHADFALYDAKHNQLDWRVYSKGIDKQYVSILKLEKIVEYAFQEKTLYLVYQPQVDLKTNEIVGLEALVRLKKSFKKDISPATFIPIIEKSGNADRLNKYVVNRVLEDIALLKNKKPLKIAVNISPKVLKIDAHVESLVQLVENSQDLLDKKQITLEFEITESSFMHGAVNLLDKALSITKKAGISCAMDDFGVEYSSISRLTQYPFDMVKIDQFFVQKLDKKRSKAAKAVIRALVQLAKDLNFIILAEGPETKAQVDYLIELGCQYAQGFYFYKPMPMKAVNKLIK